MHYLISYDIPANKTRARVAKHLERRGIRLQKSVFLVELKQHGIATLKRELFRLTEPCDDLLIVPLQGGAQHKLLTLRNNQQHFQVF